MMVRYAIVAALLGASMPAHAQADGEQLPSSGPVEAVAVPGGLETVAPGRAVLPAGTFLMIQLDEPVTSRTAARGDMFPISLAEPINIDGVDVIPAGIVGEGQVIHAAGKGFGGRAGELIVAARYLMWGERRIALRGMRISAAGRNNTAEAIAASAVLTVAGLFVTGTSVDLPAGQIAVARLAEDVPTGVAGASVEVRPTDADRAEVAPEGDGAPASLGSSAVEEGEIE